MVSDAIEQSAGQSLESLDFGPFVKGQIAGDQVAPRSHYDWEKFYNLARPHGAFKGKAPYEILRERPH